MTDKRTYLTTPPPEGHGDMVRKISNEATRLNLEAIACSVTAGHAGLIRDAELSTLTGGEHADLPLELCLHGLWDRVEGGYSIRDRAAVEEHIRYRARRAQRLDECAAGDHELSASGWYCERCLQTVPADRSNDAG